MNNIYSKIINLEQNNLLSIVHTFIEKIKIISTEIKFIKFLENMNNLLNSLIDICIKNKINYFIKNNISFSSIKSNFIIELEDVLLIFASITFPNIEKNIVNVRLDELCNNNTLEQWNNTSFILCKKQDTKNKVSFNPTAIQYTYKIEDDKQKKTKKKSKPVIINLFNDIADKVDLPIDYIIGLLIKVIFINNLNNDKLENKIYNMCQIINDVTIEYDILQPYKTIMLQN
jgi:hypothetical protein